MDIIVKHLPSEYPTQIGLSCGETNSINILSAFQIPYTPPGRARFRIRMLGYSFIEDISALLEEHGLAAPILRGTRMTPGEQLGLIKGHIDQSQPVLAAIGNGYLTRGTYSPLARLFLGHFITIYGYSDQRELFYVYDPYLKGDFPGEIPAGNDTRSYQQFIRDWKGPIYYGLIRMRNICIPVSSPKPGVSAGSRSR